MNGWGFQVGADTKAALSWPGAAAIFAVSGDGLSTSY